jgi:hypothetical protein
MEDMGQGETKEKITLEIYKRLTGDTDNEMWSYSTVKKVEGVPRRKT